MRHERVGRAASVAESCGRFLTRTSSSRPSFRETERAVLVSGDRHLLALTEELPVLTAREFLVNVGG